MNPIRKVCCRWYQAVFHIIVTLLPFPFPQVIHDIAHIPGLLTRRKIRSVLIVTGSSRHRADKLAAMEQALGKAGIAATVYDRVVPDPTVANVEEARALYLEKGCQALIGFGGGSPIDCAKAVGARIARPRMPIPRMKGLLKILRPIPYLIAVPTTAGSGSETTIATVITDEKTATKFPISDLALIPRAAVLDPEMTRSLPPHLTAATGMDALTHAIEAFIGGYSTPATRRDALRACALVARHLENAYRDGDDMAARAGMLEAAHLAGRAFTRSCVGYCHAVAHTLGGTYHIPHGVANAVLLPHVLRAYGAAIDKQARDICRAMDFPAPAYGAGSVLADRIEAMNTGMNIPKTLPGICRQDIPRLAKLAEQEANPLYPVPVLMDAGTLEQFYFSVME